MNSLRPRRRADIFVILIFLSLFVLGCNSSSDEDRQKQQVSKSVVKPKVSFVLLTQSTAFERVFAQSAKRGLTQGIAQLSQTKAGFGLMNVSLVEHNLSEQTTVEEIESYIKGSAAVFAVLDPEFSYLAAQAASRETMPFFFLNDGPMRTCRYDEIDKVAPTIWQSGLTDAQVIEPLLIHFAEELKVPEKAFRFSFFSNDSLWPREVTASLVRNVTALGFEVVRNQTLDVRITDFYRPLRRILRDRAEILFLTVEPYFTQQLLAQTTKMLIYKDFSLATLWLLPEEQLATMGSSANRVRTVTRFSAHLVDKEPEADKAIWSFSGVASLHTAMETTSYITVQFLQKAALKAKGIDAASLNAGLQLVSLVTPQSTIWFNRDNHVLTQSVYAVTIENQSYENPKYLGDIQHPGVEQCSHAIYKEIAERETGPSVPMYE